MKTVLALMLGLCLLVGCVDFSYKDDPASKWELIGAVSGTYRIVDREYQIVCYSVRGGNPSCVKDAP
jgi:hypothetical protein